MAAHQAAPSLGFSRQEHWSGLPFPSPMHASKKWKWNRSVVSDSSWPHGLSPPGSSIHGIFRQEYWSGVPSPSKVSEIACLRGEQTPELMLDFSSMTGCSFMGLLSFWLTMQKSRNSRGQRDLLAIGPFSEGVSLLREAKKTVYGKALLGSIFTLVQQDVWAMKKCFFKKRPKYFTETYSWKLCILIDLICSSSYYILDMMLLIVYTISLLIRAAIL